MKRRPGALCRLSRLGDQVAAGQVLCIIEAMKLMNEIESDVSGEVVKVLVNNGQPWSTASRCSPYGQKIIEIQGEPSAPSRCISADDSQLRTEAVWSEATK